MIDIQCVVVYGGFCASVVDPRARGSLDVGVSYDRAVWLLIRGSNRYYFWVYFYKSEGRIVGL